MSLKTEAASDIVLNKTEHSDVKRSVPHIVAGTSIETLSPKNSVVARPLETPSSTQNVTGKPVEILTSTHTVAGKPIETLSSTHNAVGKPVEALSKPTESLSLTHSVVGKTLEALSKPTEALSPMHGVAGKSIETLSSVRSVAGKPKEILSSVRNVAGKSIVTLSSMRNVGRKPTETHSIVCNIAEKPIETLASVRSVAGKPTETFSLVGSIAGKPTESMCSFSDGGEPVKTLPTSKASSKITPEDVEHKEAECPGHSASLCSTSSGVPSNTKRDASGVSVEKTDEFEVARCDICGKLVKASYIRRHIKRLHSLPKWLQEKVRDQIQPGAGTNAQFTIKLVPSVYLSSDFGKTTNDKEVASDEKVKETSAEKGKHIIIPVLNPKIKHIPSTVIIPNPNKEASGLKQVMMPVVHNCEEETDNVTEEKVSKGPVKKLGITKLRVQSHTPYDKVGSSGNIKEASVQRSDLNLQQEFNLSARTDEAKPVLLPQPVVRTAASRTKKRPIERIHSLKRTSKQWRSEMHFEPRRTRSSNAKCTNHENNGIDADTAADEEDINTNVNLDLIGGVSNSLDIKPKCKSPNSNKRRKKHCRCYLCGLEFDKPVYLNVHLMTQHRDKLEKVDDHYTARKCKLCGTEYKHARYLKDHVRKYHSKKETSETKQKPAIAHKCMICGTEYRSSDYLKSHLRILHGIQSANLCLVCNKQFVNERSLKKHMRAHMYTGQPYICETCGKKFALLTQLKKHKKARAKCYSFV